MIDIHDELYKDLEAIKQIAIVPTMLDVVCRATGLGYAAIARVTDNRWLACSVLDQVNFGLAEGAELQIETTICNEIRDHHQPVVIDHVAEDELYMNHHTPKLYGLQSYISYPIMLKNGDFFGTICAIGTQPAKLNDPKILGTFSLFAELIAFHLQSQDLMKRSHHALQETSRQLIYSQDENQLYQQISHHNLQEPLRKIRLYSDMLVSSTDTEITNIKRIASKINSFAGELSNMIQHVTDFSSLSNNDTAKEKIDLNTILEKVYQQLAPKLEARKITIYSSALPAVYGIPVQLAQLFFQLLNHAVAFSKSEKAAAISIFSQSALPGSGSTASSQPYHQIIMEQKGIELDAADMENLFDIFVHSNDPQITERYGAGLAYCRKIVHHNGGKISAEVMPGEGLRFSITLPAAI